MANVIFCAVIIIWKHIKYTSSTQYTSCQKPTIVLNWNLHASCIHVKPHASYIHFSLLEKCPYSEFFWSVFFPIWTEYGEILRRYSVYLCIQSECGKIWTKKTPNTDSKYGLVQFFTDYTLFQAMHLEDCVNPFQTNIPCSHLLKTSEKQRFSDVFRGYRYSTLPWNWFIIFTVFIGLTK